jgi:hypothetical protein
MSGIAPGAFAGAGISAWDYSFRITPIILTGGIAQGFEGGAAPIVNFTQPDMFATLADLALGDLGFDNFFAHFGPLPGGTLIENAIGEYPFANQAVAANAIINMPLVVPMMMECAVRPPNTYWQKFAIMQSLKATLDQHSVSGGTYTVLTPTFPYQNGILMRIVDISSGGETNQPQIRWQWDFRFPLVTLQQATQAYNNQMSKLNSATPGSPTTGQDTSGSVTPAVVPSAAPSTAASSPNQDFSGGPADFSGVAQPSTSPGFTVLPPTM